MKLEDMSTKQLLKKLTRIQKILASRRKCETCGKTATHTEEAIDHKNQEVYSIYLCDDSSCESELLGMDCPCDSCLESARARRGVPE